MAVGVLAGPIHIEAMMRMLHGRDGEAFGAQERDQSGQQRGLAAAGPADDADDLHPAASRATFTRMAAGSWADRWRADRRRGGGRRSDSPIRSTGSGRQQPT